MGRASSEPLPFEDLFFPLVIDAVATLRRQVDESAWDLLTSEAHADWARYLLSRLTSAGSQAADWQFQIYRSVRSFFASDAHENRFAADAAYREFVGSEPKDRLRRLFDEFPVLEELCIGLVGNWCATVAEFLGRLHADGTELNAHLPPGDFTFPLKRLQAGLGDPHRGGRCVVRLDFGNGVSVIYKPRSLAAEAHFTAFLEQLNASGILHPLKSALCWDRGEYGWMENAAWVPCGSFDEVRAFYWRTGALLGLLYLARGVDFHQENLIAVGENPVLVDLETLGHPQEHAGADMHQLNFAVQRTGFLPQHDPHSGINYDWSALSRNADLETTSAGWTCINQDDMIWKPAVRKLRRPCNLPVHNEKPYTATDFIGDIQAGFEWLGERLLNVGPQQTDFLRWLNALTQRPRRVVNRSTTYYRTLARRLASPYFLRQGTLSSAWRPEICRALAPVSESEIRALEQGDIPYLEQGLGSSEDAATWLPSRHTFFTALAAISDALSNETTTNQPP